MFKFNSSHLNHKTVIAKIEKAMRNTRKYGADYVTNANGLAYFRISKRPSAFGAFTCYAGNRDVTDLIYGAMRKHG